MGGYATLIFVQRKNNMIMTDEEKYKFHLHCAVVQLQSRKEKNGGWLLNGNFSFIAKEHGVKVKDLRKAFEEEEK